MLYKLERKDVGDWHPRDGDWKVVHYTLDLRYQRTVCVSRRDAAGAGYRLD